MNFCKDCNHHRMDHGTGDFPYVNHRCSRMCRQEKTMDSWENYKDDTNKRILEELPDELKNKINELGRLKAELDSKEIREWKRSEERRVGKEC